MDHPAFTPALGYSFLTPAYDLALRIATREGAWRRLLLAQLAPQPDEAILDVGCGTGTFAILVKQCAPTARVVGLDPDPSVLAIAQAKANRAGVAIEWRTGFAKDAARVRGEFDKCVSSLVFHQVPLAEKHAGIRAMFDAVGPDGSIHIADYARQPDRLMQVAFRIIQRLDGFENTQPNADGALERILGEMQGVDVAKPLRSVRTPTGAISLFRAVTQRAMRSA